MIRPAPKSILRSVLVGLLILAAYTLRFFIPSGNYAKDMAFQVLRAGIYGGVTVAWGFSVGRRILQNRVKGLFIAIAAFMVFWMILRFLKFTLPEELGFTLYLWYLYYIPMLFIPLLAFRLSLWLGRPDDYRVPAWTKWLYPAAFALFLLVMTNNMHQLVFRFPEDAVVFSDSSYTYGPLFVPVFIWRTGGLLATFTVIFLRSRVPGSRRRVILPLIPVLILFVYGIFYISDIPAIKEVFIVNDRKVIEDLTITECMLIISILECCLRSGLISSNTHYGELFSSLGYSGIITDIDYAPVYVTRDFEPVGEDEMRQAEDGPVEIRDGLILKNMSINGGHILWTEDVSEITALQNEAAKLAKELEEENDLLQAEIAMKEKKATVDMRNRLYDAVVREIPHQFEKIEALADAAGENGEGNMDALKRMCVLGAYIKRRCNLLFISEEKQSVSSDELVYCIRESLDYIRLCGAECALNVIGQGMMASDSAKLAYDIFEAVTEAVLDSLSALLVTMEASEEGICLKMQAECECSKGDLSNAADDAKRGGVPVSIDIEEGIVYVKAFFEA